MTTRDEIYHLRSEVKRLQLKGMDAVLRIPIDRLPNYYNGTGAEWMPSAVRDVLDGVCAPFKPAVLVHDVETCLSDGTPQTFAEVNRRFLANCQVCAKDAYPWYSWKRYALLTEARIMYDAIDEWGWKAWLDAYMDTHLN